MVDSDKTQNKQFLETTVITRFFNLFKQKKKEIKQDLIIEKSEEEYSFQERMIRRWAYDTINKKIKDCEKRTEERGGKTYDYWTDKFGNDLKMITNNGDGYLQVANSKGEVFGLVCFTPNKSDTVAWVQTSEPFDVTMRWFMAHS